MIRLGADHLEHINAQAVAAYPRESCGLLAGHVGADGAIIVTRVVESANLAPEGFDKFEVDPKVRFDLMRALENTENRIIGHYHSHPGHPPEPSPTDLEMAFEPELIWLITTIAEGQPGPTRAWRLDREAGSSDPLVLVIAEQDLTGVPQP